MDSLKRAFKGLFKRGKKNKQEGETPQQQTPPTTAASPPTTTATTTAAPPQLPPVQNASPLESPAAEDAPKTLPPTHPLSTGSHTSPQEAVPQKHDAEPGPPSSAPYAPTNSAEYVRGDRNTSQLESTAKPDGAANEGIATQTSTSPHSESQSGEGVNLSGASAAENSDTLPTPLKTDSAIGSQDQPVADADKENTQPSTNGVPATSEEKIASIQDEPPPIKAVKAAPGMSATSGPLEDFPEGGDLHDDEPSS